MRIDPRLGEILERPEMPPGVRALSIRVCAFWATRASHSMWIRCGYAAQRKAHGNFLNRFSFGLIGIGVQ